jgi:hypothetical protein
MKLKEPRLEEPKYWMSLKTYKTYSHKEYANIEISKHNYLPLPMDEYPYTLVYEETKHGKWVREIQLGK